MSEQVILVDEDDNELGTAEKMLAHRQGLLHRAFSIFILQDDKVLLQQRHPAKYHCGNLWTNTCCSHPRLGETIIKAANRRLQEEMGITSRMRVIGSFCYKAQVNAELTEHEFDHVLIGQYNGNKIKINPTEVNDYKWVKLLGLHNKIKNNPSIYTPWLMQSLQLVIKHHA